ncbi:transposase IS4 family protein [Caldithrix abyssi DSM 13497]|uniref:Transposase IS4 family protein n=1 Tax=Caldithrix abyssi DSM 13497 TaxID=880073 RepID=H1XVS7_CALAY|nr:IS1634 family transposase [Caldithrix abyssi]EHO40654.1 transposase IS4 family protein [Caldithrix abyssi DSM 13497]
MFIKEVTKKNKGYDKTFVYHQLVESYRTEKGPRQRKLLNLGKLTIPKDQWKTLANRIEEIISGQTSLIEVDEQIEQLAQRYASLLIQNKLKQEKVEKKESPQETETIFTGSVKFRDARSIGGEYISLMMLRKLKFNELLKKLGFKEKDIKLAELLIVGRLVHPSSEWATLRWVKKQSAIDELLELDLSRLSHNKLYRITDQLLEHKDKIENGLVEQERLLFSLQEKIILYDLTNTYFESSRTSELKARGRSKDKRYDMPLVTLGLVLDEDGFPKESRLFSGNVSEPETLSKILDTIGGKVRKLIILDAGIATEENLQLITKRGHDYLVVSRSKPEIEIEENAFKQINHDQPHKVEAYLYRKDKELYLYCRSASRQKKEEAIRQFHQQRFEAELKYAAESLHKKRGTKKYSKVLERIGRIKERHAKVAYFYDITVEHHNGIVTEISWKIKDEQKMDDRFSGTYYLRTSRLDLTDRQIWQLYISLTDVEDGFRSLKSELGLRPNFHQKDKRIEGHIFISILAFHVLISLQKQLHDAGVYHRWSTIRELLSVQQRVSVEMKTQKGDLLVIRDTTEPEAIHYLMAQALKIKPKPLGSKKIRV